MRKTRQIIGRLFGVFLLLIFLLLASGLNNPTSFFMVKAEDSLPISTSSHSTYVYRFWSDVFKGHFFTTSYSEATHVKDNDSNWSYEHVAYNAYNISQPNTVPVYRFWSDVFHGHFYTSDYDEYVRVKENDSNWQFENVAYYVFPLDYEGTSTTVWRFWSPVFLHHFYTSDVEEMERVRNTDSNWDFEGPAFKVPLEYADEIENTTQTGEVGEVVELNDTSLQIEEVVNSSDNGVMDPIPNHRIISIKTRMENIGDDPIDFGLDDFALVDSDSEDEYLPIKDFEVIDSSLQDTILQSGEAVEGYVSYEIPDDLTDLTVSYQPEYMEERNNQIDVEIDFVAEVVVVSQEIVNDQFSGDKIVGTVRNNTDERVRYIKITANFYDEDDILVSTDFSYAEGAEIDYLESGGLANFRIWLDTSSQVDYYELEVDWQTY